MNSSPMWPWTRGCLWGQSITVKQVAWAVTVFGAGMAVGGLVVFGLMGCAATLPRMSLVEQGVYWTRWADVMKAREMKDLQWRQPGLCDSYRLDLYLGTL